LCLISITDVFVILTVSGNLGREASTKEKEPVHTHPPFAVWSLLSNSMLDYTVFLYIWNNTVIKYRASALSACGFPCTNCHRCGRGSSLLKVLAKFPSECTSENSWCIETTAIYYFWMLNELALLITAELVPFLFRFTYRAFLFVCCVLRAGCCSLCSFVKLLFVCVSASWFAGEIFLTRGKGVVMIIPGCAMAVCAFKQLRHLLAGICNIIILT